MKFSKVLKFHLTSRSDINNCITKLWSRRFNISHLYGLISFEKIVRKWRINKWDVIRQKSRSFIRIDSVCGYNYFHTCTHAAFNPLSFSWIKLGSKMAQSSRSVVSIFTICPVLISEDFHKGLYPSENSHLFLCFRFLFLLWFPLMFFFLLCNVFYSFWDELFT